MRISFLSVMADTIRPITAPRIGCSGPGIGEVPAAVGPAEVQWIAAPGTARSCPTPAQPSVSPRNTADDQRQYASRSHRRLCSAEAPAGDLSIPRIRGRRRVDQLRAQLRRELQERRNLRRPESSRAKSPPTCRSCSRPNSTMPLTLLAEARRGDRMGRNLLA